MTASCGACVAAGELGIASAGPCDGCGQPNVCPVGHNCQHGVDCSAVVTDAWLHWLDTGEGREPVLRRECGACDDLLPPLPLTGLEV